MKLQYFIPALLVSICVACPGKDAMGYDFGEFFSNPHGAEGRRKLYQAVNAPYCQSTCGATVVPTAAKTCSAYSQVKSMADSYFDSTQSVFDLSNAFGAIVRLAFHDAAEVDITDDDILGPDGCLSTDDGNSGLVESGSFVATSVEYAWQQVCDRITRADFWVMLGKIAVERSEPTGTIVMDYQYGRKDANYWTGCSVYGRLPGAEGDVDDFYQVFVTQMGMNLNDAATLLGAHTVGHSHPSISGYGMSTSYPNNGYFNGFDDTPHIFDNNYYYNLHTANWYSATAPANGNLINFLSTVYPQTCMLPADISSGYIRTGYSTFQTQTCGPYAVGSSNPKSYGCTPSSTIMPLTCWQSCNHGNSNSYFLQEFRKSWNKMTCAGYGVPANTAGASASGKLGTLYYLDLDTCSA